jgi:hypothetical protein
MTDQTPPRTEWWRAVEEHLEALFDDEHGESLPQPSDPWAHSHPDAPDLTSEQRALLAGADDQPGVPRLTNPAAGSYDQPSVPRIAHQPDRDEVPEEPDPPRA